MKDRRVAGFFMVLALVIIIIGVAGPIGAKDQDPALSSSEGPVVGAPAAPKAPAVTLAATDAVLSVTGSALRPRTSNTTFNVISSGGGIYAVAGSSFEVFNTPVHLPKGAQVKSLRLYFYDADPSASCYAWFSVYNLNGDLVTEWSAMSPAGSVGAGFADSAAFNHTIDNTQYTYLLNWRPNLLGSNMQLRGLQLTFTPPPGRAAVIPMY
jgi:hypothetical protein